jgi:hypothetical protein
VVPVFVPGGSVCVVTVGFHGTVRRDSGSGLTVSAQSPRAVHPLVDSPQLAGGSTLGESCSSQVSFNDSGATVFTGAPGGTAAPFRSGMGPVFDALKGLPAAAVNGGWLITVRAPGADGSSRLECAEVVVRTR